MEEEEILQDPRVLGVQGLKGLKGVNIEVSPLFLLDYPDVVANSLRRTPQDFISQRNHLLLTTPAELYVGVEGYGNSKYDNKITDTWELQDLNETRARMLPWYDLIGAGLLKGTALAWTTFADGVIGTPVGLLDLIGTATQGGDSTEVTSAFWNNPVSNFLQDINEKVETALPNYYSKIELESPWYDQIFTSNFIGDKFLKNYGFLIGTAMSGKVNAGGMSKALGLKLAKNAFKGIVSTATGEAILDANLAYKAYKTGDAIIDGTDMLNKYAQAANKLRYASPTLKVTGAVSAAAGEARIEAISNSRDYEKYLRTLLDDYFTNNYELITNSELSSLQREHPEYFFMSLGLDGRLSQNMTQQGQQELSRRIQDKYEQGLAKISKDRLKMGNTDFILNMPLLAISDVIQFGKMFAGGFKSAKRVSGVTGNIATGFGIKASSKVGKVANLIKNPLAEGNEEMLQGIFSEASGLKYASELNSFYGEKINPDAELETTSLLNNLLTSAYNNYTDINKYEEFAIGALTGALGVPSFRVRSKDGKIRPSLSLLGGIAESLRDIKEINSTDADNLRVVEAINNRIKEPEFLSYYLGLVRRTSLENKKAQDLQNNDEFSYKNHEHSLLISDAIMFDGVDKIDELYDTIDSAANIQLSQVTDLRNITTNKLTGKSIYDGMTDLEVVDFIKKLALEYKETVDTYRSIADNVKTVYGVDNYSSEALLEITWMMSSINNWENRFASLHEEIKDTLEPYLSIVNSDATEILNANPLLLLSLISAEELLSKIKDKLKSDVNEALLKVNTQEEAISKKTNNRGKSLMLKKLKRLRTDLENNLEFTTKYPLLISKVNDLARIAEARTNFIDKLGQYLLNPNAISEDMEKANLKVNNDVLKKDTEDIVNAAQLTKNILDFRNIINTSPTSEVREEALKRLQDNELAKLFKEMDDYDKAVNNGITNAPISSLDKDSLRKMFRNVLNKATSLAEVKDLNNPNLNDETILEGEDGIGEELEAFQLLKFILQDILNDVNNSLSFKDNIKLEITTVPKPTSDKLKPNPINTPIGLISDLLLNTETKQLNDLKIDIRGYWKPALSEISLEALNKGEFIPLKDTHPLYKELYEYLEKLNAFNYVNEGNIKVGDEVKFEIDPELNNQGGYFTNIILITHKNLVVGVLDETNAANFEGLKELRDRILTSYKLPTVEVDLTTLEDTPQGRGPYLPKDEYEIGIFKDKDTGKITKGFIAKLGTIHGQEFMYYHNAAGAAIGLLNGLPLGMVDGLGSKLENVLKLKEFLSTDAAIPHILNLKDLGKYTHTESTHVAQVLPGRVPFGNIERSIKDITPDAIFGIMKSGAITVPNSNVEIVLPIERNDKEGRMYMMIKGADNKYYPTAVRVSRFNNENPIANTSRLRNIESAVRKLASSKNNEEIFIGKLFLENELYLGNDIHFDYFSNEVSDGLRIRDNRDNNELVHWIIFELLNASKELFSFDGNLFLESTNALLSQTVIKTLDEITLEIIDTLRSMDLPILIKLTDLNTPNYNTSLINDNLLTSNINKYGVVSASFTMNPLDADGVEKKATNIITTTPLKVNPITTGVETAKSGILITYNNNEYYVLDNGDILNNNNEVITNDLIKDLAWIKKGLRGDFGDIKSFKDKYQVGKIFITPNNKYINIGNVSYATELEINDTKVFLLNREIERNNLLNLTSKVEQDIINNLNLIIERPSSTNNFYMILEEDGVYPYERVTNVIGNNYIGPTSKSNPALSKGTIVDSIIRLFFNNEEIIKPENISSKAFDNLLNELNTIKDTLNVRGERFLTNNIVLFGKYNINGEIKRIAGETDIISIDNEGNFRIYDIKTSTHDFRGTIFNEGNRNYLRSPKEQYTLLLSGYNNLFEYLYKLPITLMAILPFKLNRGADINEMVKLKGINITYNPQVEEFIPKLSTPIVEVSNKPSAKERLNRFKGKDSTKNLQNSLDNSNNIITFASQDENIKKSLTLKGYTEESFNVLSEKEKQHEINCAK